MSTSANIDAGSIIATVSQSSASGFIHIALFMILLGGMSFMAWKQWLEHQDRKETKKHRGEEWHQHEAIHNGFESSFNEKIDSIRSKFEQQNNFIMNTVTSFIEDQKKTNIQISSSLQAQSIELAKISTILEYLKNVK
jgi:uncharacterized membrane protein YhiD involved in acid resistance